MWSEAFQKKDITSLSLQNELKWPCQSPGQKTPPRQAVSSRDFRKQYKIYLKMEISTLVGLTNYSFPAGECFLWPFLLHFVISSTQLPYCFLSVFLVWILLTKVNWFEDLRGTGEIRVYSVLCLLYKTLASGCLVLKDSNYKQPLTPVWVQMQRKNVSVSWLARGYHHVSNFMKQSIIYKLFLTVKRVLPYEFITMNRDP